MADDFLALRDALRSIRIELRTMLTEVDQRLRALEPKSPRRLPPSGAASRYAVLTDEQAKTIRKLHDAGSHSQVVLARQFGVSRATVHNVVSGKRYGKNT